MGGGRWREKGDEAIGGLEEDEDEAKERDDDLDVENFEEFDHDHDHDDDDDHDNNTENVIASDNCNRQRRDIACIAEEK